MTVGHPNQRRLAGDLGQNDRFGDRGLLAELPLPPKERVLSGLLSEKRSGIVKSAKWLG